MLLEVDGEVIKVFSGLALATHVLSGLGPRRAWRVGRLAHKASSQLKTTSMKRRDILKGISALIAGLTVSQLPRFQVSAQQNQQSQAVHVGEEYGGFLILEEGAQLPSTVMDYKHGIPTMCGAAEPGMEQTNHLGAIHLELGDASALAQRGGFPFYTLGKPIYGLRSANASLVTHSTGESWGGWVTFEAYDHELGLWYTAVSILAQVDFMRPIPLWLGKTTSVDSPIMSLEKVDFLPSGPGVLIRTPVGFSLHWVQKDVYYTLIVDHLSGAEPREVVLALVPVI
jgi:hypothetical protein